ncbi:MAG: hypothetical protein AB1743_05560, partial [Actinomycetota bacterium]
PFKGLDFEFLILHFELLRDCQSLLRGTESAVAISSQRQFFFCTSPFSGALFTPGPVILYNGLLL